MGPWSLGGEWYMKAAGWVLFAVHLKLSITLLVGYTQYKYKTLKVPPSFLGFPSGTPLRSIILDNALQGDWSCSKISFSFQMSGAIAERIP